MAISAVERHRLLCEWNDTASREAGHALIHDLFSRQARRTPWAVAVEHPSGTLSYGELDRRSEYLAIELRRQGVGPEVVVGLAMERGPKLIVTLLAILKAGGAYLPLDPTYPTERLAFMLRDSGASVVAGSRHLLAACSPSEVRRVVVGGGGEPVASGEGSESPAPACTGSTGLAPENLAYAMYTSGSTGRPKGSRIRHRSVVRLVRESNYVSLGPQENLLQFAPISFDASTFEIWGALLTGGRLVVVPAGTPSLHELGEMVRHHRITTLWLTAALFQQMVDTQLGSLRGVRQLLTGGDVVPVPHARKVLTELPGTRLVNGFGPTENTTFTCCFPMIDAEQVGSAVSIGRPIGDTEVYVLDERLRLVPAATVGELATGGAGLARDYLNRPSLTAERFVPHPWSRRLGARLYRIGDRTRYLPDGRLEFLGRLDHQVKIRGFRVEPREVEALLLDHPRVREAAVVAREDGPAGKRLVAFLVPADAAGSPGKPSPPASDPLRHDLEQRLPTYMVPSALVWLEQLPQTPNGKVDRRALAARELAGEARRGPRSASPRTATEELLAGIWAEVLGVEKLGVRDDFFALGGHSLLATRLLAGVQDIFQVELAQRTLFDNPTLAGMASQIERAASATPRRGAPPLVPVPRDQELPLSFAQQRLWFFDRLEPGKPLYNVPLAVDLRGQLEIPALAAALAEVVRRHEVLRSRFVAMSGQPVVAVDPPSPVDLPVVDLSRLPAPRRASECRRQNHEEARRSFDLARGPLIRGHLLRLGKSAHQLVLNLHHIVCDARSIETLLSEIAALYTALLAGRPSPLDELPIQYADFSVWQREWLGPQTLEPQLDYWKKRLENRPAVLELPLDRPRPSHPSGRGQIVVKRFPAALRDRLTGFSRGQGASLYMTLLAAFDVLLHQFTHQRDLVVGVPVMGRRRRELEPLLGFFINTLVLRVQVPAERSFRQLLSRVRDALLEADAYQDLPFERLVEELSPQRSLRHNPLIQVVLNLFPSPVAKLEWPGFEVASEWLGTGTSKFDLTMQIEEAPAGLAMLFEYSSELFDRTTIDRLSRRYSRLLEILTENPEVALSRLGVPAAVDRHQLLVEWNDTASREGGAAAIHRLFSLQARRRPEAVAVVQGSESLSYGGLERASNRLAGDLRRHGAGPEVLVGVAMDRSCELIVALLGILKAGGAYLPFDSSYPPERLEFVLEDSGVELVVGSRRRCAALPLTGVRTVIMDGGWDRGGAANESGALETPRDEVSPEHLAYVMYTSGSTGRPKGTRIRHRSVVRLVRETRYVSLGDEKVLLFLAPIAFDASTFEIWGALLNGDRLAVMAAGTPSLHELGEALERQRITTLFLTSALFQQMVESELPSLRGLRELMTGGDVVPVPHVRRALDGLPELCLSNIFGPTENTTFTTSYPMRDVRQVGSTVSIGRPIGDTEVYVLDHRLAQVAAGVAGELYCAGAGLARDYLERPALTAESFVPHPWSSAFGARLYRIGDQARQLADGRIEFLGRLDQQVKIRGFRVEPGEVEAVLLEHPAVRTAAVVVRQGAGGDKRLAAYLVPEESLGERSSGLIGELSEYLKERLPGYMVPSALEALDALPLTPNDKVDRRALARRSPAAPAGDSAAAPEAPPRTLTEELLAGIWSDILGQDLPAGHQIGRHDNFFELGGHSLVATRMVSRIRTIFALELPLHEVFAAPTVAELAAALGRRMAAGQRRAEKAITRAPREGSVPLSFAQNRLWFLDRLLPDHALYNVPLALDLRGSMPVPALAAALVEVKRRHDVLRSRFVDLAGRPRVIVDPPPPAEVLPVVDLSALDEQRQRARVDLETRRWGRLPFDLGAGPPMRSLLLRRGRRDHRLVLSLHHIVCDGWSLEILLRELPALYEAARQGRPSPLTELPIQYADFALWQHRRFESAVLESQIETWRRRLAGSPELLELPADRPRPARQSLSGSMVSGRIPDPLRSRLLTLAQAHGTTLFMVLLATFKALLFRHSGQQDVLVGSPIAGRSRREIEPLVGFFVNTLVMRTSVAADQSFGELLRRVRETVLWADAHQDVPFERLVEELRPERSLSHSPLFQVALAFHTTAASNQEWPDLETAVEWVDTSTSKFDLTLAIMDSPAGCDASIEYSTELFDRTTARRFLVSYLRLLDALAAEVESEIGQLCLLSDADRHQLLTEWNDTASREGGRGLIHQLFTRQARRGPEAVALVQGSQSLSYGQLERASDRLAGDLRRHGVGPEVVVGVSMDRGCELIVALLAILKAGGAYLPFDSSYPPERLEFVLQDSGVELVVGTRRRCAELPLTGVRTVILDGWDRGGSDGGTVAPEAPRDDLAPEHLAYVMYTSGSTGRPKGTRVRHRSVARLVRETRYVSLGDEQVLLHFAPIAFDASTFEIWGALLNGGRLAVMAAGTPSLRQLGEALERHRITTLWLTSALFQQMVESELPRLSGIRQLLTGGDVVPVPHVRRALSELPGLCLINGFGPTENTTFTTCHPMRDVGQVGPTVSIGRPIGDTEVYVLDRRLAQVAVGVAGELYCAGAGLARDYLKRPALTAERFVPHPWSGAVGTRLYRIGDQARQLADGRIEFLGRLDQQVKIRGFRVEPGEVEAVLLEHPAVSTAAVVVRQGGGGDKRLAAFVVLEEGSEEPPSVLIGELSGYLKEHLPEYMVPSTVEALPTLPLTPNDKVDRRALARRSPASAGDVAQAPDALPRTATEELLAGIWSEILGQDLPAGRQIGRHDNFFELGGHSLVATQMVSRIRKIFALELPLLQVFAAPTLAELATVLAQRMAAGQRPAEQAIERASREGALPLSFAQNRLWFLDRLLPGHALYNVPLALDLRGGAVSVPALAAALTEVKRRHEVLRSRFLEVEGRPQVIVDPPAPAETLPVVDLSRLDEQRRRARVDLETRRWARLPFDLGTGPLMRSLLLRRSRRDHRLMLSLHHIICDGWSFEVLERELPALYGAALQGRPSPLPELPIQYSDFALWQHRRFESAVLEPQLDAWRRRLSGSPELLELPADRPRPAHRSQLGSVVSGRIPRPLRQRLLALAQGHGTTLFMVLLAAFKTLLFRHSGQQDVLVGCPISGRGRREIEPLVGFFVNALVMRTSVVADQSFGDLVRRVRETVLWADAHQDVPFEGVVEALRPGRSLSHSPLFQVSFAFLTGASSPPPWPELEPSREWIYTGTSKFDLTLGIMDSPAGCDASLEYSTELFDRTTAARFLSSYLRLLDTLAGDVESEIGHLCLLSDADRHQLLAEWNDTASREGGRGLIHRLFSRQAQRRPEAVAVVQGSECLSYGELERASDRLAGHLRRHGVGPEVLVGVSMDRGCELIAALLAILKAGGAYLPFDSNYPPERLEFVLEDSGVELVVGTRRRCAELPRTGVRTVLVDGGWDRGGSAGGSDVPETPRDALAPEHLAYVMYTSGSTGRPKGTRICHQSVVRLVRETRYVSLGDEQVLLFIAPIAFDASTFEIWGALLNGDRLAVMSVGTPSLRQLGKTLERQRITTMFLTSALFQQMVETELPSLRGVRQLLTGGDVVPVPHSRRALAGLPDLCLSNIFGPTENTTFTTSHPMRDVRQLGSTVSIGRPIGDTEIYLLDRRLAQVPVGVAGELYCAGAGLARDYLKRPALTAERFVPHPWSGAVGTRLYRIGDQARQLADGRIDFLGRLDQQVKIRGFRVEPGEVEAVLLERPAVGTAAVVVRQGGGGDKRLAAFVVLEEVSGEPSSGLIGELSEHLKVRLPGYMVPSTVEALTALPLTPNDKVDRRALARRSPASAGDSAVAPDAQPRTLTEELLAGIWSEILGQDLPAGRQIGRHDNFFELGGHSLVATRMVSRIREVFALELPLRHVFVAPTLAELAAVLVQRMAAGQRPAEQAIERAPREAALPLSFAQNRLWFLDRLLPGHALYNVPLALDLRRGAVSVPALAAALVEVIRRHEVLRSRFVEVEGRPEVVVDPPPAGTLPVVDLSGLDEQPRRARVDLETRRWARLPFDLGAGPLMRSLLLRRGRRDHRLVLSLHHIICDGWSFEVLERELPALYGAALQGRPSPLPELPIQYADFALWQHRRFESAVLEPQLDAWRRRLSGSPELLELPADRPRPAHRNQLGSVVSGRIPRPLRQRLLAHAQGHGTTLFMVLLAAFKALLFRHSGQQDVLVGCPISGRGRREIEPLVGFFVNALVMRTSVAADQSFGDLVRRVRETVLWADAHQDVPFEGLVEALRPGRSLSHSPLFQVSFAFLTGASSPPPWPELEPSSEWIYTGTSKFDLTLGIMDSPAGCDASIEYSTELFDRTTARRYLDSYSRLLEALASDGVRVAIGRLQLLGRAVRHQLLAEWNDTTRGETESAFIHHQVSQQARRAPEAPAVQDHFEQLSYGELERDSDLLASFLQRQGVGPEVVVGVLQERTPRLVVTQLAILKAGGAYLSLDPDYPDERLEFMLRDSGARVVVGESYLLSTTENVDSEVRWVELDTEWPAITGADPPAGCLPVPLSPSNLAYLIYTSGSTGWPKGVAVSHAGLSNLVRWHRRSYRPRAGDQTTQLAGLSFDASVWEMWPPLAGGASLHLVADILRPDPAGLLRWLADTGVTQAFAPTPLAEALLETPLPENLALRILNTGGDQLHRPPPDTAGFRLINHYGPAESSVVSTSAVVSPAAGDRPPPIGRPIDGIRSLLLDRRLELVAAGLPGELAIGGQGLARGYLGRPSLTAERFVPDPCHRVPGSRLYRTGDRVRQAPSGELEFLGRVDHQVELRGFRIEPGEIEAVLGRHPAITQAVAVVSEPAPGSAGRRLVAFVVAAQGMTAPGEQELFEHLGRILPEHMVPSSITVLSDMPLTPNGKVDRAGLARRAQTTPAAAQEADHVAPRTPTEELLAGIWAEILGSAGLELPTIGAGDNFFELGGHSLLATQVVARVRQAFGVDLTVRELFEHPTAADFAAVIDAASRGDRLPPLTSGPAEDEPVLSFTQERFWFLDQMTEGTNTYSVPLAVLLEGELHFAALERFFGDLLVRHEVLRATFPSREGQPTQRISPRVDFILPVADLEGLDDEVRQRELNRLVSRAALRPFDLGRGPLMRVALVRLEEHRHALLVGFHHIVADAWSLQVMIAEAQAAYGAFVAGRPSPLPPLPIQYRDFARWQRSWLGGETLAAEIAHWRAQLGERPSMLDLPRYPAAQGQPLVPATERFRLPPEAAAGLKSFSQRRDATLFVTLLAAYGAVLGRYSGQGDVVVGTVVANRGRIETEGLIGCFLNTLALPLDLSGDPSFDELVVRVRRSTFEAYAHQDLPFEKLVEAYNPDRRSIQPLFQAFFTLETSQSGALEFQLPGLEMRALGLASPGQLGAKFDLALGIGDTPGGLLVGLGYNAALYPPEVIERMASDFRETLLRVAEDSEARVSELPGPSADERRALAQRFAGAAAGEEAKPVGEPEKDEQQQLADERSELDQRLAKLPPALRARFAKRLKGRGKKARQTPEIPRRRASGPAPLSFAQERLWFVDRLEPGSPAYNIPIVTRFRGALDVASLARSLDAVIGRHEVLRTVFELAGEVPVQRAHSPAFRPLPVVDLRRLADSALADSATEMAKRMREEGRRPFDLRRGPLVRACLFALGDEHVLIFNVHHIVFDGWSTGILIRELQQLYEAFSQGRPSPLAELPIQYADFATWQREWLQGERLEQQLAWWRERLDGIPPALELPTDRPRPAVLAMAGAARSFALPAAVATGIRRMIRGSSGTTPFMVLLAASKALLYRLTGETDLVLGTPIANRNRGAIESLIGFFVNTLVLRTDLSSDLSFSALVDRVRETTVEAYDHQDLPFEKLVEDLQPERNLSQTPLFQAMFVYEEAAQPGGAADRGSASGPAVETEGSAPIAKFDLTLAFVEHGGELEGVIEYRTSLFDAATVRRWGGYLERLLTAAVADPGRRLSELPLVAAPERQQLLVEWNDTRTLDAETALVPELFFRRAQRSPDAVAVLCGARRLTYGALAERAQRLAADLRRQDVGPGTMVGLCMDHREDLLVAIFGIFAAGGAYLPLEPTLPAARLSHMLDDAGVSLVVANAASAASLPPSRARVHLLEPRAAAVADPTAGAAAGDDGEPARPLRAGDPAYLIYTSGSTGTPKAVVVEHGSLLSTVEASRRAFGWSETDRLLCLAPFSFDISVFDFLCPLLAGATAVLIPSRPALDLVAVAEALPWMTRLEAVPAVMQQIVDAVRLRGGSADRFAGMRSLFVGGDRVPPRLLADLRQVFPSARVWVLYGPTEATIICSYYRVPAAEKDPRPLLGRPLADVELRVADRHGRPVPAGVSGEIYIGGPCVARGYLNRDDLTAEKYPSVDGSRFYRSGDLGRFLPDGNLEFLGRIDHQVKVRGQRIELGEIEAMLAKQPAIAQAAVLAQRHPSAGGERLVGYVVGSGDEPPRTKPLEDALAEVLPDYMVPREFVVLEALPLTVNGKVDRSALDRLAPEAATREPYEAPRDRLELELCRIWEDLLGRERIGIGEDFFAAGGHSLLVSRLQLRIESLCGWRPPVASLFRWPTIEKQAALLRRPEAAAQSQAAATALVAIRPTGSLPPLFCVHSGSGHVASYHALAHHLGSDQPFFAFQSPGLEDGGKGPETIEDMAATYLAELRAARPEGPYHLTGWSMGGLVALEMARQLLEQGQKVALLALLDTRVPDGSDAEMDDLGLLATFALHLGIPVERLPPPSEVERLGPRPLPALRELAVELGVLPSDLEADDLERFWNVFRRNAAAVHRHVPKSYPRRAFLLTAEDEAADPAQDAALGWGELITDLEIRTVPGSHFTMVGEPHVEQLAGVLSALIEEGSEP